MKNFEKFNKIDRKLKNLLEIFKFQKNSEKLLKFFINFEKNF